MDASGAAASTTPPACRSRCSPDCTSSSTCRWARACRPSTRTTSRRGSRRPRAAGRTSSPRCSATRVGEAAAVAAAAHLRPRVPRGLQGGLRARPRRQRRAGHRAARAGRAVARDLRAAERRSTRPAAEDHPGRAGDVAVAGAADPAVDGRRRRRRVPVRDRPGPEGARVDPRLRDAAARRARSPTAARSPSGSRRRSPPPGTTGARSTDSTRSSSTAGLRWRQALVLRAYSRYMRQIGSTFSQQYLEDVVVGNVRITRLLVRLFETRFAPAASRRPARRPRSDSSSRSRRPSTAWPASTRTASCARSWR